MHCLPTKVEESFFSAAKAYSDLKLRLFCLLIRGAFAASAIIVHFYQQLSRAVKMPNELSFGKQKFSIFM
jgi:hypothetical protein